MPVGTPKKASSSASAKRRLFFGENDSGKKRKAPPIEIEDGSLPTQSAPVSATPQKKIRYGRAKVVTPEKEDDEKKEGEYVPTYIHKNLSYHRKGKATLNETTQKAFDLVTRFFRVPENFEQDRRFGPIAGTCFEERLIQAYDLGMLEPIEEENAGIEICSNCACEGHKSVDCPQLI
ncbi:MAG: hypothetical protein SGBAC_003679 [Bacillariaceae sp.]